jgi:hypothetical protein
MATHSVTPPQTITIETTAPTRGHVTISATVQPQTDPLHDGLHLLFPPADLPVAECYDFPRIIATVKARDISGYGATFGWIQLFRASHHGNAWKVDQAPALQGLDMPFICYGVEPTFFDAPAHSTAEGAKGLESGQGIDFDVIFYTFLCALGKGVIERSATPIAAFTWGLERTYAKVNKEWKRTITLNELKVLQCQETWKEILGVLRAEHPSWEFKES